MLTVADALMLILEHARPLPLETVALTKALHRTLAADVTATMDSPPFDKALMDGFAVASRSAHRAQDGVVELAVVETITAGMVPTCAVDESRCARIMTGAPLPDGCDCVVPIELTTFDEASAIVRIADMRFQPTANLIRRGTAAQAGSTVLKAGTRLQPQMIAALAEFGISSVECGAPASVAVLATGDELVAFDQQPGPGQIRNSNEPMLLAQVACSHALPVSLGVAHDSVSELRGAIQRGLRHDILLLTGGVSAGMLDLVPQQLIEAGVTKILHGVNMKPGKPLWFGVFNDVDHRCLVFGLPGNPVSSLTCFELFVRPAIDRLHGQTSAAGIKALLTTAMTVKGNRPTYHPSHLAIEDGRLVATPIPWSGSSDLRATVEANGMVLLLPEANPILAGAIVDAWFWNGL